MTTESDSRGLDTRVSTTINLKDVITFVSIAVSITLAWGVFGTRLTVLEKELVYQSKAVEQNQKQLEVLKDKTDKLEMRIRDNEDMIQTMWGKHSNGQK
jgi:hypothetical protein